MMILRCTPRSATTGGAARDYGVEVDPVPTALTLLRAAEVGLRRARSPSWPINDDLAGLLRRGVSRRPLVTAARDFGTNLGPHVMGAAERPARLYTARASSDAPRIPRHLRNALRLLTGVKWSQVQILSARPETVHWRFLTFVALYPGGVSAPPTAPTRICAIGHSQAILHRCRVLIRRTPPSHRAW
jgi:hypothetical protein